MQWLLSLKLAVLLTVANGIPAVAWRVFGEYFNRPLDGLKQHLELLGAQVAGPAATTAEATKLIAERLPHVALVDFHLRGEDSSGLIAQLREEGVPVIMLSGSFEFPAPVSPEGVTMVEKPISEAQILQHLKPILKAGR
jgi:CheY-like chemotaxis protein